MKKLLLALSVLILGSSCSEDEFLTAIEAKQFVIAHRGSCQLHGFPENSRASLKEALSLNIYGTEFDVRQTKDGILVISHDDDFNGLEISKTDYNDLLVYTLSNGETIPTLKEFFAIFNETISDVKLIVELKYCDVDKVVRLVNSFNIQDNVDYISFNKTYCDQLAQIGLGKYVLYLNSSLSPSDIDNLCYGWICYEESTFSSHPEWVHNAEKQGLKACILWPANDVEQMKRYANMKIHFFTDTPTIFN